MKPTLFLLCAVSSLSLSCGRAQQTAVNAPIMVKAKTKPDKEWKEYPTRTLEQLAGFTPSKVLLDRFGGWKNEAMKQAATGFFAAKKIDGRWWLITPDGYPFLHVGVVSVTSGDTPANREALAAKFGGDKSKWGEATVKLLNESGFNGAGAWSDVQTLRATPQRVAYTQIWNFMSSYGKKRGGTFQKPGHTGYPGDAIFVFDPEFASFAEEHAKQLSATKDDPYLLGHFSDNEMPLPFDALDKFLSLPAGDHGQVAAQKWLDARKKKPSTKADINEGDRFEFRKLITSKYFEIVSKAIKKYDPNHLFLGSRFHGGELRSSGVFGAAGKYLDVIAINYYGAWTPNAERMADWERWSGKPFLITEWYVKGDDVGFANTGGAGWIVPTQADRGLFYQNFTLGLLQSKSCVGWHWFKYMDNDPANLKADPSNRDSNKGNVNLKMEPYTPLLSRMKSLNEQVYPLTKYFDAPKS